MLLNVSNLLMAKRLGRFRPRSNKLLSRMANRIPPPLQKDTLTNFEKLLVRFDVHSAEAAELPLSPKEFINEELSKSVITLDYSFILTTANKVEIFFENQLEIIHEPDRGLVQCILTGEDLPFLLLIVDRHHLIDDTFIQLETIADLDPADFCKQLWVQFKDEKGIDHAGRRQKRILPAFI